MCKYVKMMNDFFAESFKLMVKICIAIISKKQHNVCAIFHPITTEGKNIQFRMHFRFRNSEPFPTEIKFYF